MKKIAFKPERVAPIWRRFQESLPVKLVPIQSEAHYRRMVLFLNNLIGTVCEEVKNTQVPYALHIAKRQ